MSVGYVAHPAILGNGEAWQGPLSSRSCYAGAEGSKKFSGNRGPLWRRCRVWGWGRFGTWRASYLIKSTEYYRSGE